MTIGNPAFCLPLYLTGVHFWGEFQHIGDVSEHKFKGWPIRSREIGGVRFKDGLHNIFRSWDKINQERVLFSGGYKVSFTMEWPTEKVHKFSHGSSPAQMNLFEENCLQCRKLWYYGNTSSVKLETLIVRKGLH